MRLFLTAVIPDIEQSVGCRCAESLAVRSALPPYSSLLDRSN